METLVQVKAQITDELRHRFSVALARRDEYFTHWLRARIVRYCEEVERGVSTPEEVTHARDSHE